MACTSFSPIMWSHKDTDETIEQVVEHNAVGMKLCPGLGKWISQHRAEITQWLKKNTKKG